jgi:hypothetical protein
MWYSPLRMFFLLVEIKTSYVISDKVYRDSEHNHFDSDEDVMQPQPVTGIVLLTVFWDTTQVLAHFPYCGNKICPLQAPTSLHPDVLTSLHYLCSLITPKIC